MNPYHEVPIGAQAVPNDTQLTQLVVMFVRYYDKHGSHQLGNGEAFRFYVEAKRMLERIEKD